MLPLCHIVPVYHIMTLCHCAIPYHVFVVVLVAFVIIIVVVKNTLPPLFQECIQSQGCLLCVKTRSSSLSFPSLLLSFVIIVGQWSYRTMTTIVRYRQRQWQRSYDDDNDHIVRWQRSYGIDEDGDQQCETIIWRRQRQSMTTYTTTYLSYLTMTTTTIRQWRRSTMIVSYDRQWRRCDGSGGAAMAVAVAVAALQLHWQWWRCDGSGGVVMTVAALGFNVWRSFDLMFNVASICGGLFYLTWLKGDVVLCVATHIIFTHEGKNVLYEYLRRPHMYGFTGTCDCCFTKPVIPQDPDHRQ